MSNEGHDFSGRKLNALYETRMLPSDAIEEAIRLLEAGYPVGLPTETVYGLAADALEPAAVAQVFAAKGRPHFDPLIVHLPAVDWIERVAELSGQMKALVETLTGAFWPGALTLIVPKRAVIPDLVTSGMPSVAIRMSAHPVFRQVCEGFGRPLAAPSANRFGRVSPTMASHVIEELGGHIPAVLDGGACVCGIESTILKLHEDGSVAILRPGPITAEQVQSITTIRDTMPSPENTGEAVEAPGQLASHYAPATTLRLVDGVESAQACASRQMALLAWDERSAAQAGAGFAKVAVLAPDGDATQGAARLFKLLRELDAEGVKEIIAMRPPSVGLGVAIADRLARAAAPK